MKRKYTKPPYTTVHEPSQEELESLKGTLFSTVVFVGGTIILFILLLLMFYMMRF
ncbi:hypothetical protein [Salinicoccus roseus]|uniref:hypothetical protein n=1 Tax=Salinicoccus roseus TaxID=45670 RepID=UPI001CA79D9E|nr:hypothetical protein [Salinicoccus roseus]MBY8909509.1 hypothetical protein [Salinicoccus roseus]